MVCIWTVNSGIVFLWGVEVICTVCHPLQFLPHPQWTIPFPGDWKNPLLQNRGVSRPVWLWWWEKCLNFFTCVSSTSVGGTLMACLTNKSGWKILICISETNDSFVVMMVKWQLPCHYSRHLFSLQLTQGSCKQVLLYSFVKKKTRPGFWVLSTHWNISTWESSMAWICFMGRIWKQSLSSSGKVHFLFFFSVGKEVLCRVWSDGLCENFPFLLFLHWK